jgi:hypothetical protein
VPSADGCYRVVPGHPSKHGANTEAAWSRPPREDHHDIHLTGLRRFGDRRAGAARAVDTFHNSRCVEPAACHGPRIDHSSTRDSPPVSPSMVPEALSNSEGVQLENVGWLKMSQVNRSDGVLAPHRDLSINRTPDPNFGGWDVTAPPLGVARARRP